MSQPRFLLDEHLPLAIIIGLQKREPAITVTRVGQPGVPPRGSPDPVLLDWIEQNDYMLVTNNRASMPVHLAEHLKAGRRVAGILIFPFRYPIGAMIDQLYLIWAASRPGEYDNQVVYLPF